MGWGHIRFYSNGYLGFALTAGHLEKPQVTKRSCPRRCTCGSEPAREKSPDIAFIQTARVFVDVLREQARSHRGMRTLEETGRPGRPPRFCFCGARPLERPSGGSAQWATRRTYTWVGEGFSSKSVSERKAARRADSPSSRLRTSNKS